MAELLRLKGQAELIAAFSHAGPNAKKFIRKEMESVAEPIAHDAEQLALSDISHIGNRWSKFRIGVTQKLVYVVPKQGGGRGPASRRRPNLADLLMGKALGPAFDQNEGGIEAGVERALEHVERNWAK